MSNYSIHTKRSPEFCKKVDSLIHQLHLTFGLSDLVLEITEVLLRNTTDSACIVNAEPREPIFVLRGHDPIAGNVVRYWVNCADSLALHQDKVADALECADQMFVHAREQVRKLEGR